MPPKCRFTREEVVAAALELTREGGFGTLTARALGERLGASPRPIFSLFQGMEEVRREVIAAADGLYQQYISRAMAEGRYPPYKASGMAYIEFARDQRELFKLLFMRDRGGEPLTPGAEMAAILPVIMKNTGLSEEDARMLHMEMWVFVHGIAAMIVTSYLDWETKTVSRVLTDAYMGLKARFCEEAGKQDGSH